MPLIYFLPWYASSIFLSLNRTFVVTPSQVTKENLQSIVQQLLSYLVRPDSSSLPTAAQSLALNMSSSSPDGAVSILAPTQLSSYRLILVQHLLTICSQDTYDNVVDFQWYLSVLLDLTYVASVKVGNQIRDQLVDIVARVRGVKRWAVELMTRLVRDDTFLSNSQEEGSCAEVLWAAAWICGENSRWCTSFVCLHPAFIIICGAERSPNHRSFFHTCFNQMSRFSPRRLSGRTFRPQSNSLVHGQWNYPKTGTAGEYKMSKRLSTRLFHDSRLSPRTPISRYKNVCVWIHAVVFKSIPLIYCFRLQMHCNYLLLSVPTFHRFVRKMT